MQSFVVSVWLVGLLLLCELPIGDAAFQSGIERCLNGSYHKDVPSPEVGFKECHSWQQESCCNVKLSHDIHHNRSWTLYAYKYDRCGDLSPECEAFIKDEECFYQCEPYLTEYEDPIAHARWEGTIRDVPICSRYCDAMYDACKNDQTCVENWFADFDYTLGENHCPKNSKCRTFADVYGNGIGLCNKMWGNAFYYETDNTKCMVMNFDPNCKENPNRCAKSDCTVEESKMCDSIVSSATQLTLSATIALMVVWVTLFKGVLLQ